MARFANCGYEVEDRPYCRGYWDFVCGLGLNVSQEAEWQHPDADKPYWAQRPLLPDDPALVSDRDQYMEGYKDAMNELKAVA